MKAVVLSIILVFVTKGLTYPQSVSELPADILKDLISIATSGVVQFLGNCTEIDTNQVELLFFSNNNSEAPLILDYNNPTQIQEDKPLVFVTHGWISNASEDWILSVKNEYLKKDPNYQVILVNWATIANRGYATSVCNLRNVADIVATFLCTISDKNNVELAEVHLVGHSLGAQISGFVGKGVQKQCYKTVGRITGLDPAGPAFQALPGKDRLTYTDAIFVDVIHTNTRAFGYRGNIGTVDFYPNCGGIQKGCLPMSLDVVRDVRKIAAVPLESLICSHAKSYQFFAESINSDGFEATSCTTCPLLCIPDLFGQDFSVMGENTNRNPRRNAYVLETNPVPPFAIK